MNICAVYLQRSFSEKYSGITVNCHLILEELSKSKVYTLMAFENLIVGCLWCITIIGIPFGKQFFKMERLSFMPFGANVIG